MIIIGEKLNSSIKAVKEAIENSDSKFIEKMAQDQASAGANFIDVNAGMFLEDEPKKIKWLVKTVENATDIPLSIDSPNSSAIEAGLKASKNKGIIINSITYEKKRYDEVISLVDEYKTGVVALCMDDNGMPETVDDRLKIADKLIESLTKKGISLCDIYIDPMVRPIGTGPQYAMVAIETIRNIKKNYKDVHIACGLSNISFGIPARKTVNQAFLVGAMFAGMDGAILDPLDEKLMSFIYATEALTGVDEYCINYIMKFKEGQII